MTDNNQELEALSSVQFGNMFEKIYGGHSKKTEDPLKNYNSKQSDDEIPWKDDEDRLVNFCKTTKENYNKT